MSTKNVRKTYYPQKSFDDDLDAFAQLSSLNAWSFSGVDAKQLSADAVMQRDERARFEALSLEYHRAREAFGVAQEARHQRFSAALNAARGAFQRDKEVLAQLERFRRSTRPGRKVAQE